MHKFNGIALLLLLWSAWACQEPNSTSTGTPHVSFLSEVHEAPTDVEPDAAILLSTVNGAGETSGNTDDVVSLGYESGVNNVLVLGSPDQRIQNGEGTDFVVFENPFRIGSGTDVFMDLIIVAVSLNGIDWVEFPYDYVAEDETTYSASPTDWMGFAGKTPVLFTGDDPLESAFDVLTAGGDGFDLDALNDDALSAQIKSEGFHFLRLTSAPSQINPDTGAPFVRDAISNGADVDGVVARYVVTEEE